MMGMGRTSARARRESPRRIGAAVTDLDGTLLRTDGTLSDFTRAVLAELHSNGFPVITATARTPRAVRRIVGSPDLGVVVCANGAIVWDAASNGVIMDRCFDRATLTEALVRVRSVLPRAGFAILSADTMFIDDTYRRLRRTGAEGAELVHDVAVVAEREPIAMVALRHPELAAREFIDVAADAFDGVGTATFASVPTVDICPAGISKAATSAEMLARAGCPAEGTVAFGDMPNDLPLLAWAGWACAVQNAHPEVLRAADEVIPPNDDDGVAHTLQRLLKLGVNS
jgi:Cof subfamily protein (haloacid dehalogenase superfamily)